MEKEKEKEKESSSDQIGFQILSQSLFLSQ